MLAPEARSHEEQAMLKAAEELSRSHMQAYNDPSHDWYAPLAQPRVNNISDARILGFMYSV